MPKISAACLTSAHGKFGRTHRDNYDAPSRRRDVFRIHRNWTDAWFAYLRPFRSAWHSTALYKSGARGGRDAFDRRGCFNPRVIILCDATARAPGHGNLSQSPTQTSTSLHSLLDNQ